MQQKPLDRQPVLPILEAMLHRNIDDEAQRNVTDTISFLFGDSKWP